jgi:putative FmdB family regulatory protein
MPTYEYKCPKCGTRFEEFQRITVPPGAPCPRCGAEAERLLSGGGLFLFKGSGFYATDYKRSGEPKAGPGEAPEAGSAGRAASDGPSTPKPAAKPRPPPQPKDE